jgi:trans-2,3-dihydro-3-hydroxyanthranilate isomerase
MSTHPFAIVDVFADEPLTGNPLAVVTEADDLTHEQMASIAAEFHLSETTFVCQPQLDGADRRLRSFTPDGTEVEGAGHNTLGAWWWLVAAGEVTPPGAVQELGPRTLTVHIEDTGDQVTIGLDQGPCQLSEVDLDRSALGAALSPAGPVSLDDDIAPVTGSVGSTHLLVAADSHHDVDRLNPDGPALQRVLSAVGAQGCYVYTVSPRDPSTDAYSRFFNPTVGIAEDPATGSAAGPLAAHLHRLGLAQSDVTIQQGHRMGRPSRLDIGVSSTGTTLTGRCALAARGELQV